MIIYNIKKILFQIWWPISINTTTKYSFLITNTLLKYHENKINDILINNLDFDNEYNISDLFSLYKLLEFIINFLWEEEFNTVTGLDLYEDWYKLLNQLKKKILEK